MNLSRSTYYHKPKQTAGDDDDLIFEIEVIIEEFPGYGYRRVTRELLRRGKPTNHKGYCALCVSVGLSERTNGAGFEPWAATTLIESIRILSRTWP